MKYSSSKFILDGNYERTWKYFQDFNLKSYVYITYHIFKFLFSNIYKNENITNVEGMKTSNITTFLRETAKAITINKSIFEKVWFDLIKPETNHSWEKHHTKQKKFHCFIKYILKAYIVIFGCLLSFYCRFYF